MNEIETTGDETIEPNQTKYKKRGTWVWGGFFAVGRLRKSVNEVQQVDMDRSHGHSEHVSL